MVYQDPILLIVEQLSSAVPIVEQLSSAVSHRVVLVSS